MNRTPFLTPFRLRLAALEESSGGALRLPPFTTTISDAQARVDPVAGDAVLTAMPLDDGLRLGLPEREEQRLRAHLYEIAAARLGRRLAAFPAVPGEVPVVDLALPALEKRMAAARAEHWQRASGDTGDGGYAQAIASGWLSARQDESPLPPLSWTHECRLSGHMARALLKPLWESYEGSSAMPAIPANAAYEARIEVTLPGRAMSGWYGLGPERTHGFFKSLTRVSASIQRALRSWLPLLWMGDGELFHSPREGVSLLAYASLPALLARSRRCYTYDPVDSTSWLQALTYASRRLQKQLQVWYPALTALDHPAAELVHPRWHSRWGSDLMRNGKRIQTLLANEAWLIDQFVNFAAGMEDLAGEPSLNGCIRKGRELHGALDARLRRWWEGRQAQALNSLLLLEATSALTREPVSLAISLRKLVARQAPEEPLLLLARRGPETPAEPSGSGSAA